MKNQPYTINHIPSKELISNEIKFLISCCQTDPSEDDINFINNYLSRITMQSRRNEEDHELLIATALQHGVLPLVYKTIKHLSQSDNLNATRLTLLELNSDTPVVKTKVGYNAEILTELKAHYMSISQRNMLMTSELIKIMHLLRENNIKALAFKGPTLSQTAYGDITLRQFGDLDILIKNSDISPMIDLLVANGYVPELELDMKMKETAINALNVIGFHKNTSNVRLEVHWKLLSKNYAVQWDTNELCDQARQSVTMNHASIPTLPPEEQLLYLCIHGSKHLFERLEWVCDIDRSIKTNPDINWPYLLNEADKRGIKRMLYFGLALCQYFFRLELPEVLQNNIQQDKVLPKLISKVIKYNFSEPARKSKDYSYFILMWHMRENLSDKLRFAWYAFFAPQFDDLQLVKLPEQMAFLYPLVRQFRLIKKYVQR